MNSKQHTNTAFSTEQCDALFAAVLVHDDLHLKAELPDKIHLDYSQEQLTQCYQLCRQMWTRSVDRKVLSNIIKKLSQQHTLSREDQLAFRYIRAKFKHLRFAYITFDRHHRYPFIFHRLTIVSGKLQDAFRNNRNAMMSVYAILLRLMLSRFFYASIIREIERFQPSTPEKFHSYIDNEIHFLRLNLAKTTVTSKIFHEMRKVISRQVALYDNLKILYPSAYHNEISLYLSTLNGLMGNMHDELIAKKFENRRNYYDKGFEIPEEIRIRLTALTQKYDEPQ